jgi:hypothetical protein
VVILLIQKKFTIGHLLGWRYTTKMSFIHLTSLYFSLSNTEKRKPNK